MPLDAWETVPTTAALSTATATGPHPAIALTPPPASAPFETVETVTMHDVELCAAGDWTASTGPAPIDVGVLEAILEAARDPEVDTAMVHPGHFDPRFPAATDGEPTLGTVRPTRIETRRGRAVLLGDIAGIPSKLATVIRQAYPRRSVELAVGAKTPSGKTYRAALTGLGLLGVQAPAVKGLADVMARYSAPTAPAGGQLLTIVMGDTPADAATLPSASVSGGHDGADATVVTHQEVPTVPKITDKRLRELLGLAADADVTAVLAAVEPLMVEETPTPVTPPAAVTPATPVVAPPATAPVTVPAPTGEPTTPQLVTPPAPVEPPQQIAAGTALPGGLVAVDPQVLATLTSAATTITTDRREGLLTAALSSGRIAPAQADGWRKLLEANEDQGRALLEALPANTVPVEARGNAAALAGVHATPELEAGANALELAMFGDELAAIRALPQTGA